MEEPIRITKLKNTDWCRLCGHNDASISICSEFPRAGDTTIPIFICEDCLKQIVDWYEKRHMRDMRAFRIGYSIGYDDGFRDNWELHD